MKNQPPKKGKKGQVECTKINDTCRLFVIVINPFGNAVLFRHVLTLGQHLLVLDYVHSIGAHFLFKDGFFHFKRFVRRWFHRHFALCIRNDFTFGLCDFIADL